MEPAVTGIISHDVNGIVIGWDAGAEKIFGYSHAEIFGSPVARLIPPDRLEEKAEILQRLVRMERVAPFETIRLCKDGRPVSVLLTPSPVPDFTGQVVAITKVVSEATEHQEAEPTLAEPLTESVNDSAAQRPERDHSFKRELSKQICPNPPVEEFPIEASISQVMVNGGKASAIIPWDMIERQRTMQAIQTLNTELAQQVKVQTEELQALNKELEAFSYSVSHDLRAPLRNVSGFIGLLAKSVEAQLAAEPQRYLKIITKEAKRMGELIDELLAFSRIGRAKLQKTQVDLTRLVQEVQVGLDLELKGRGRDVVWQVGDLPQVYGDRALLRKVLVNLMANALKFTRTRTPAKIEVGTMLACVDKPGGIFVRDNGVGFDMRYSDKLFTMFQRLHRVDEFEGTGVGLANVQRIIHRHGGRVWAEAAVDQGATFFVALPNQE